MATPASIVDALIIGAGPAGLSVATGLARQLHTAIVFSNGVFRNAKTKHMHNVVGWDHRDPADFRAAARKDLLARYSTIRFHDTGIKEVSKTSDDLFEARDMDGQLWTGKKLVLAMGVIDVFPDISGYADCWGESIFHCLFCDGYEERGGKSSGILATDHLRQAARAKHVSHMAKRLAERVTIYTNGDHEQAAELEKMMSNNDSFHVEPRSIAKLENRKTGPKVVIHFQDGTCAEEAFLAHSPKHVLNGPFSQQLGLETTEDGDIKVSPMFNETSMPGVFAVGDCATAMKAVTPAMSMGTGTASAISIQLQQEEK